MYSYGVHIRVLELLINILDQNYTEIKFLGKFIV